MSLLDKINLNISSQDTLVNDYLYVISEFGGLPNKIALFDTFDTNNFLQYVSNISELNSVSREIVPDDGEYVINEKTFCKITYEGVSGFYLTFIGYDILSENSYISDILIYYKHQQNTIVDNFLEEIKEFAIDLEPLEKSKYNLLNATQDGISLEPLELNKIDIDNIQLYYNDIVIKSANKISKKISKSPKGLTIVFGERGTGKTSIVSYILSNIDKSVIFIPSYLMDIINTNEIKNIISTYKDSIIVIDDSEMYFTNTYNKSNIFSNNLLQLVDGIASDANNTHFITILNTCDIEDIDDNLLDCNNIIDILEVDKLNKDKVVLLMDHLSHKKRSKISDTKLVDVIHKRYSTSDEIKMGFH